MTTVSVALATFNGAAYLAEQLESLSRQDRLPDELVISDDGSTDNTLGIARAYAQGAPFPVRLLADQPKAGFADNFLRAARACTGEVVAFCDQDDVWRSAKIGAGLARLEADGSLLAIHTLALVDEELQPLGEHRQGIASACVREPLTFEPERAGWGNSLMFRRRLLDLAPGAPRPRDPDGLPAMKHDTYVYVLAAALGRVSQIAEPLVLYRQHRSNAVGPPVRQDLRSRIDGARSVPLGLHRARLEYYEGVAGLFELIAADEPDLCDRARAAARHYRRRADLFRRRLDVYTASPAARMASLAALVARGDGEKETPFRARALSRAKDLVLGVLGLGLARSAP